MTDVLGYRLKVGMLVPSTNSTVQPEMDDLRPPGVTNHVSRIAVPNQSFASDADAAAIVAASHVDLLPAIDRVMACNPDLLIMAMAVPCFWAEAGMDAVEAGEAFKASMAERAGVPVITPPDAIEAALHALGARRFAAISPYMPLADAHVRRWFEARGFEVKAVQGLRAAREDAVVDLDEAAQFDALDALNEDSLDALVQVGTSMASLRLVERFEATFGRPVLSVNAACYWHALRSAGVHDPIEGAGTLLSRH